MPDASVLPHKFREQQSITTRFIKEGANRYSAVASAALLKRDYPQPTEMTKEPLPHEQPLPGTEAAKESAAESLPETGANPQ